MTHFFFSAEAERGQAIVMIAGSMMALLMMVGLAIDAGQLYAARRTMQESADAAAYAGAVVLYQKGSQADARAAAVEDGTRNGYTHGVGNASVVVNLPPTSGPNTGNGRYVEVIINDQVRTALVPAQSALSQVRVRGVAGAEALNNGYGIMALDRGSTNTAFRIGAQADVHITGGGVQINSTSNTAATNSQNDACRLTIEAPYGVDIAGNTSSSWPGACASPVSSAVDVDAASPQQADPFAGFPKPQTAGMPVYNSIPGLVVQPGVYTVPLDGPNNQVVTLSSGVYVLKAGLNTSGRASLTSGPGGVFIFNTHSDYPGAFVPSRPGRPGSTCGNITLTGDSNATNLSPMTTGTFANFLVYQDANCANQMEIKGLGTVTASGTIYLPSAHFVFAGTNANLVGSQLIAKTVDIQNGNITINFDPNTSAQPLLPRLTE
ncbi:MAG TPA: Tad domain-containing protein [Solirubrobacteraceae bacterium]|nr:Tad domain-containing protein [Solirubrobacteraceae bacterium]